MATYPTIPAGQRLTAAFLRSMLPIFAKKLANEDRSATTTLADDSELFLPLEANASYHVRFLIIYAAVSAAGFQVAWSTPAGSTGSRWALGSGPAQTSATDVGGRFGVHSFGTAVRYGDRASTTLFMGAAEEGVIDTTNAGTLALQWSQAVSNASPARIAAGSYMQLQRLA